MCLTNVIGFSSSEQIETQDERQAKWPSSWMCWHTPLSPALWKQRQADCSEPRGSLDYMASSRSPGYVVRSINMNHPRHNYLVWIVHFLVYNNQKRKYLLSPGFQKISQSHWPRHITWPGIGHVLIGLKPSNLKFKLSSSNYFYASFPIFKKWGQLFKE